MAVATALTLSIAGVPTVASGATEPPNVIVFVSDRDSVSAEELNDDIYAQDPLTGQVDRLTTDPAPEQFPQVSRDGRRLLFISTRATADFPNPNNVPEIHACTLRRLAGHITCDAPRQLTFDTNGVGNPAWSGDGRSVLYSAAASPENGIYRLSLRPGARPELVFSGLGFVGQPAASPDDRFIAFNWRNDVYRVNSDGSRPVAMAAGPQTESGPEYSPDGRRLLIHSNRAGNFDLYTMRNRPESAGNPLVNLTAAHTDDQGRKTSERFGAWSPDARQIAYWWQDVDTLPFNGQIYVMNSDGTDPHSITGPQAGEPESGNILPDWGGDAR